MSKERLEEIKEHTAWTVDNGLQPRIDDYDLAWLINRVEELEKQSHGIELNLLNDEVVRLEKKNQRYKRALERILDFYPGVPNADFIPVEMLFEIKGIAYKALEREG